MEINASQKPKLFLDVQKVITLLLFIKVCSTVECIVEKKIIQYICQSPIIFLTINRLQKFPIVRVLDITFILDFKSDISILQQKFILD